MSEENNDNEGEGEGEGNGEGEGEKKPKQNLVSMPQDEMSRIMAREKGEGRKAEQKRLMKDLGVTSEEDLKSIVEAHRKAQDSARTEVEREQERARTERAAADKDKVETRKDRYETRAERALLRAKCPDDVVSRATKLLDVEWDPATDEPPDMEIITGAVAELKKTMPQLFKSDEGEGEGQGTNEGGPVGSDPGKGGGKPQGKSVEDRVADRLAKNHPSKVKKE